MEGSFSEMYIVPKLNCLQNWLEKYCFRLEQERRRQEEMEKQLQRQRELEQEREQQLRYQQEQREAARRYLNQPSD